MDRFPLLHAPNGIFSEPLKKHNSFTQMEMAFFFLQRKNEKNEQLIIIILRSSSFKLDLIYLGWLVSSIFSPQLY